MHFERFGTWIEMDPMLALDVMEAERLTEILHNSRAVPGLQG